MLRTAECTNEILVILCIYMKNLYFSEFLHFVRSDSVVWEHPGTNWLSLSSHASNKD